MRHIREIVVRKLTTGHCVRPKWNWGLLFVRPEWSGVRPNCNFELSNVNQNVPYSPGLEARLLHGESE